MAEDSKKRQTQKKETKKPSTANKKNHQKTGPAGKKKTAGPSSPVKKKKKAESQRMDLFDEVLAWTSLAVCVFFMISVFGGGGYVGGGVRGFLFGLFGFWAYVFPVALFLTVMFLISNEGSILAWGKVSAFLLMYSSLCAFAELLTNRFLKNRTYMDYYETSAEYKSGGGLVGGFLNSLLCPTLGVAGACILLTLVLVICLIVITGRSLLRNMKKILRKNGMQVRRWAGNEAAVRREQARIQAEKRRLAAEERLLMEERKSREERENLLKERRRIRREREDTTGVKIVSSFDLSAPGPQPEAMHQVLPALDGGRKEKTAPETLKVQTKTTKKPQENRTAGPEERNRSEDPEQPPVPPMPVFAEDFSIQRGGGGRTEKKVPEEEKQAPEEKQPQEQTPVRESLRNPRSSKKEQEAGIAQVEAEIQKSEPREKQEYIFPPLTLLNLPKGGSGGDSDETLRATAIKLQQTLHNFGVEVSVSNISCGPAVTRYELTPEQGVRVSKIVNLSDDIKLNLAAADIRIEAPIPGKMAVGIEVPNKENCTVYFRELLESPEFRNHKSKLAFAAGKDISGRVVVTDIAKMPHLLIAGATGSGKSVCINTIIMSLLYKARPDEVKLIMIDPKVVELSVYNGIPHLLIPVVTDPKKAAGALNWAVGEMTERYNKFAEVNVRDLKGYNAKVAALADAEGIDEEERPEMMPQIVIVVDELADLMMVAPGDVEDAICRLAQLARAAGIHLIIATQRPSVNVITGLIKANMPSRIAFAVSSGVDSRTIIDMNGAEKLLGKGDMLFYPQGYQKPARVQGAFVNDEEVQRVVEFLSDQNLAASYSPDVEERIRKAAVSGPDGGTEDRDEYFRQAAEFIIDKEKVSMSLLQRQFKIGFNRAARLMDQLADAGVVGPDEGTKPRKVLMSREQLENMEF